jgi:hypothetical protein
MDREKVIVCHSLCCAGYSHSFSCRLGGNVGQLRCGPVRFIAAGWLHGLGLEEYGREEQAA